MPNDNLITLSNFTVINDVPGMHGINTFSTQSGANRPGLGRFLVNSTDSINEESLLYLDSYIGVKRQRVTINVIHGGQIPISTPDPQASRFKNTLYEAECYDKRAGTKFRQIVSGYYNMYLIDQLDGTFNTDTLNGSDQYTWAEVFDELNNTYDLGIDYTNATLPTTWNPRNLIFDNIPVGAAIDEICSRLYLVAGYNYSTDKIEIWNAGTLSRDNAKLINDNEKFKISENIWVKSQARLPTWIDVYFPKIVSGDIQGNFEFRWYKNPNSDTTTSDDKRMVLHAGQVFGFTNHLGVLTDTSSKELNIIGDDLATRADTLLRCDIGEVTFAALLNFNLDGRIRRIEWTNNRYGSTTKIFYSNKRDFELFPDHLSPYDGTYNTQHISAAHGVTTASSGTRILHSPLVLSQTAETPKEITPTPNHDTANTDSWDRTLQDPGEDGVIRRVLSDVSYDSTATPPILRAKYIDIKIDSCGKVILIPAEVDYIINTPDACP